MLVAIMCENATKGDTKLTKLLRNYGNFGNDFNHKGLAEPILALPADSTNKDFSNTITGQPLNRVCFKLKPYNVENSVKSSIYFHCVMPLGHMSVLEIDEEQKKLIKACQ